MKLKLKERLLLSFSLICFLSMAFGCRVDAGKGVKRPRSDDEKIIVDRALLQKRLYDAAWRGDLISVHGLIEDGADVNGVDPVFSGTALHYAALNGHVGVVEELLVHGAYINAVNCSFETPIRQAARNGHLYVVKKLIQGGADLTCKDVYGYTALQMAVVYGHIDIVEALSDSGVAINAQNLNGDTALHIAARYAKQNQRDMYDLLICAGVDRSIRNNRGQTARDILNGVESF